MFWEKIFECLEISIFLVLRALSCQINFVELSYGTPLPLIKLCPLFKLLQMPPTFEKYAAC